MEVIDGSKISSSVFIRNSLIPFLMKNPKYKSDTPYLGNPHDYRHDIIDWAVENLEIGEDLLGHFRALECGCITFTQLVEELEVNNFIVVDIAFSTGSYIIAMGEHQIAIPHYLF